MSSDLLQKMLGSAGVSNAQNIEQARADQRQKDMAGFGYVTAEEA